MDYDTWPRLLVVDTEGNGTSPPELVELAAVPITHGTVLTGQITSTLIRPRTPITPFATAVHHITNDAVASAPRWEAIATAVHADLNGAWIAAHNASVDHAILARYLPSWEPAGVIDTLRLARAARPDTPRHTLDALLALTQIDLSAVNGQRHRAAYDAHATALLLLALAAPYCTWDDIVRIAVPPKLRTSAPTDYEEPQLW